ncbi:hypothetical protein VaNZ11_010135, partial [Volvox africanus]
MSRVLLVIEQASCVPDEEQAVIARLKNAGFEVIPAFHKTVYLNSASVQHSGVRGEVSASESTGVLKALEASTCQHGDDSAAWHATIEFPSGLNVIEFVHFVIICCGSGSNAGTLGAPPAAQRHVRIVSSETLRGKQVVVVGDGCEAWDTACAISLLKEGRDVQLMLTANPATSDGPRRSQYYTSPGTNLTRGTTAAAAAPSTAAATGTATEVMGAELLDEARRRALQAALQPHYTLPAPGPLGRALRAPTKRRFWAYVKGKAERAARRIENHGGDENSGSQHLSRPTMIREASVGRVPALFAASTPSDAHLVVWAPSLRDPEVMPFLGQHLKNVLLHGSDSPWAVREQRGVESGRGREGVFAGEKAEKSWWDSGPLLLYRGMVHPDVPGLLFLGLQSHLATSPGFSELQIQWMLALLLRKLTLPPAATMRADIARQRAWCAASLAHPLMSTRGSLARTQEHHNVQQLLADLNGLKRETNMASSPVPPPEVYMGKNISHARFDPGPSEPQLSLEKGYAQFVFQQGMKSDASNITGSSRSLGAHLLQDRSSSDMMGLGQPETIMVNSNANEKKEDGVSQLSNNRVPNSYRSRLFSSSGSGTQHRRGPLSMLRRHLGASLAAENRFGRASSPGAVLAGSGCRSSLSQVTVAAGCSSVAAEPVPYRPDLGVPEVPAAKEETIQGSRRVSLPG